MYKHSEIPEDKEIQYLKSTKQPHWDDRPERKLSTPMPKGTLTWVTREEYFKHKTLICIEDNIYGINFDRDCFRPVDAKGKTMTPIPPPPKYRFKTKSELIKEDKWDFRGSCPVNWGKELNYLLGSEIDNTLNSKIERGDLKDFPDEITSAAEMTHNTSPEKHYFEDVEESFKTLPKYRFKTEREFKEEGEWHSTLGVPIGWGDNTDINRYLGKCIPKDFDELCDTEHLIEINSYEFGPESYTLVKETGIITRSFIENCQTLEIEVTIDNPDAPGYLEPESMELMYETLEKIYDNSDLRKSVVPLFIGDPGLGKTKIIEQFAETRGAKIVEIIVSQVNPFEVSGMAMPDKDTKKMTYYNFDNLDTLKDGDILFFDEVFNGNPVVLNACLTLLESRRMVSGKSLPNVMVVAAANPQGMVPLTPQIKERFVWYNVKFSPNMWKKYMLETFKMPDIISDKLCTLITEEEFTNNNFYTPRSVVKAIKMILKDCPTPYATVLKPILSTIITNNGRKEKSLLDTLIINPGESIMWLDYLKKK